MQWNIERGYQLAGIIEELKRIDADVLSLQEVDVGCDRSGGVDTGEGRAAAQPRQQQPSPPPKGRSAP
jgi:endonuclease/exonuclease/phosphatase family metal-dependent hydrolase